MAKFASKDAKFPGLMENLKPEPTVSTPTPTHEYTHTSTPTYTVRERKNRRVQLLLKESTVDALDAYAKAVDTSRNDIIQGLIEEFLKNNA